MPVIFLVGPTGVGKSDIALELAGKLRAEIISCDSMQVYKGMDIGTQKTPAADRKKIRHHMIDILVPDKEFSAADFRKRALRIIHAVHKRGKAPLFVGGTGLYMKALLDGLFPSPPKDEKLRKRLYRQKGLYEKLRRVDPESAALIHPNDTKKIVRALEIYYTSGKKKSELLPETRPLTDRFDVRIIGLMRPREELYKRIDERVDRMFEEGFLDEAKGLAGKKLSITARQAIGYKEAIEYLKAKGKIRENKGKIRGNKGKIRGNKGKIKEDKGKIRGDRGIEELKELIKKNTRRYAKRQITWFNADKRIEWVRIGEGERSGEIAEKIYKIIK